jgi:hypothetical protein
VGDLTLEEKYVLLAALDSGGDDIREKEVETLFDKEMIASMIVKCSRAGTVLNDSRGWRTVRPALRNALRKRIALGIA